MPTPTDTTTPRLSRPFICVRAFGTDWCISFDYDITATPYRGCGPSLNSPGDPPEPGEFLLSSPCLWLDLPGNATLIPTTPEFDNALLDFLSEDANEDVYEAIAREEEWR